MNLATSLFSPWINSQAFSPTDYGGAGNLGAELLAMSGPSQMPMSTGQRFGEALLNANKDAIAGAEGRQKVASGSLDLQMMMQRMPALRAYYDMLARAMGGGGLPQGAAPAPPPGAATSATGLSPQGNSVAPNGSIAAGAAAGAPSTGAGPSSPTPSAISGVAGSAPAFAGGGSVPSGLDPRTALQLGGWGGAVGAPGADALLKYASTALQYDPRTAANLALAKSPLTIDKMAYDRALQTGDLASAKAAAIKFYTDAGMIHTAGLSGTTTTFGGLTPQGLGLNMFAPGIGLRSQGGRVTPIPGYAGAISTVRGAEAGAEEAAKLRAQASPVGAGPGTASAPRTTMQYPPGWRVPQGAQPTPAPAGSPAAAGAQPVGASQEIAWQKERADETAKLQSEWSEYSRNAVVANYSLLQQEVAARNASLGPAAPAREYLEKMLGGLGQQVGIAPPKELTSYQELDKYTFQVAAAQARSLGSREAAQVVGWAIQNNPNKNMTGAAFYWLNGAMRAMNQYTIDKNRAIQSAGPRGSDVAAGWDQQIDPSVWNMTTSPVAAAKLARAVPLPKIRAAYSVMDPMEQKALVANLPTDVLRQLSAAQ